MPSYYSKTPITGNGVQTTWNIDWDYVDEGDVKATINGAAVDVASVSGNTVELDSAPGSGLTGFIYRQTNISTVADFTSRGTPSSGGFNAPLKRVQFIAQELADSLADQIQAVSSSLWDAGNRIIRNVASGTASSDAVNKGQLDTKQASHVNLTELSGLSGVADTVPYFDGTDSMALTDLTSTGRDLLAAADASEVQAVGEVTPGVDVQPFSSILSSLADLTAAADKLPYFTGAASATTTDITSFIRTLLDDVDAATARSTLGVGSGTGDVIGPVSSVDNGLALFDGTDGDTLQDGGVGSNGQFLGSNGTTPGWTSLPAASQILAGIAELATTAEMVTGTSTTLALVVDQWMGWVNGHGLKKIVDSAATSQASVTFGNIFNATQNVYAFSAYMEPATDGAQFWGRVTTGGGTPVATGTPYTSGCNTIGGSAGGVGNGSGAQGAAVNQMYMNRNGVGNATNECYFTFGFILHPGDTSKFTGLIGITASVDSAGALAFEAYGAHYKSTTAVDGIQFLNSSGNMDVIDVKIYQLGEA